MDLRRGQHQEKQLTSTNPEIDRRSEFEIEVARACSQEVGMHLPHMTATFEGDVGTLTAVE